MASIAMNALTGIAILLMIGLLTSILSNKLKISNILLLLLAGLIIGNTELKTLDVFIFPESLVFALAILSLLLIVFEGSTQFKLREVDRFSNKALELVITFLIFNIIIISLVTFLMYFSGVEFVTGILLSIIFSVIITGTDPSSVFMMLEEGRKVFKFLKVEAIINTPIIVIIPFIIIDFMQSLKSVSILNIVDFIVPFLQQIVVGIGAGILMGLVVFRIMRRYYSSLLSKVSIIATALLTYIIAENLKGNGVLAVATLGIVFGNIALRAKESLIKFSEVISTSLEILVFVLVGVSVTLPFENWLFWLHSIILFVFMVGVRFAATFFVMRKEQQYSVKEKVFTSLFLPKGVPVAVVALTLKTLNIPGISIIADLLIVTMLYSIILAIVLAKASNKILIEKKKTSKSAKVA